jgi:hypothetical protein
MKRTIYSPRHSLYPVEQEPIILFKPLLDYLLSEPEKLDLVALYCYYYYTAKWQRSELLKVTVDSTAKEVGWGVDKVRRLKRRLQELNLIEGVRVKSPTTISECRVKIYFAWSAPLDSPSRATRVDPCVLHHPWENTQGGHTITRIINNTHNLLISNKTNNIPPNLKKPSKVERSLKYIPIAEMLSKTIQSKKHIKHSLQQIKSWAYSICQMIEDQEISPKRIKTVLAWYNENIGAPFVPVVESGQALKDKFQRLEDAMERSGKELPRSSGPRVKTEFGERWYQADDGEYYNDEGRRLM